MLLKAKEIDLPPTTPGKVAGGIFRDAQNSGSSWAFPLGFTFAFCTLRFAF
jgi:hypothetical protein